MRLFPVLIALVTIGCDQGGPAPIPVEQEGPAATERARTVLEGVAETGELGSGLEELRMALEEMKQSDPAKAETLLKDLEKLEASGEGQAAQTQAKQMLNKL